MISKTACAEIWPDCRVYYQRFRREPEAAQFKKWHWLFGLIRFQPYPDYWPLSKARFVWKVVIWNRVIREIDRVQERAR